MPTKGKNKTSPAADAAKKKDKKPTSQEKPEKVDKQEKAKEKEPEETVVQQDEAETANSGNEADPAKESPVEDDKAEGKESEEKKGGEDEQMQEETPQKSSEEDDEKKTDGFSSSALKNLAYNFIKQGTELSEVHDYTERKLIVEIYETFPLFLCHDGHFFLQLVFTQEAWKSLQEEVKEEKIDLSDMIHHRLAIGKMQLQLRKVDNCQKVFTSYATLEVRFIVHEVSVVQRTDDQINGYRRPYVKSIFRDDEIRTLILSAFHTQMKMFAKKTLPEFPEMFKGDQIINQEVTGIGHAQVQIFDCLQDTLTGAVIEASDIIIAEKGQSEYERRMELRKQAEIARKQKENDLAAENEFPATVIKQQQVEFRKAQQKHQQRKDKNQLKELADNVRSIKSSLDLFQSRNDSIKLRKPHQTDAGKKAAQLVRFSHFKRYFDWFQNSVIQKDEEEKNREQTVTAEQDQEMKDSEYVTKIDPNEYYESKSSDDFAITLIKRCPETYKELLARESQRHSVVKDQSLSKNQFVSGSSLKTAQSVEATKFSKPAPSKVKIVDEEDTQDAKKPAILGKRKFGPPGGLNLKRAKA